MSSRRSQGSLGSVLVIGGCGFLGHHIVKQLTLPGFLGTAVSVLDLDTRRNRQPSVSYYEADITSANDVRRVYLEAKPQVVIHTASPIFSSKSGDIYHAVNVEGTRILLETAGQTGHTVAFIYTSSPSVVHDGASDLVMADERLPVLRGSSQPEIYNRTKGIAENYVLAANRRCNGIVTCAIRPSNMFGAGDTQLLSALLNTCKQGTTRFQLGDNSNLFDFTCVSNAAHAHILAAQQLLDTTPDTPADKKVNGEAFLITNDQPYYFWDFVHAVWGAARYQIKPEEVWVIPVGLGLFIAEILEWMFWLFSFGSREPNLTKKKIRYSALTRTFRIDKAKSRLKYEPIMEIGEGIRTGVKWYLESQLDAKKWQ